MLDLRRNNNGLDDSFCTAAVSDLIYASIITEPYFQGNVDLEKISSLQELSAIIHDSAQDRVERSLLTRSCKYLASYMCDLSYLLGHSQVQIAHGTIGKIHHHWIFDQKEGDYYDPMIMPGIKFKLEDKRRYQLHGIYPSSRALFEGVSMLEATAPIEFDCSAFHSIPH